MNEPAAASTPGLAQRIASLGYAVTSSWEINLVWMPLFIAWALKLILLRYAGLPGFRRSSRSSSA